MRNLADSSLIYTVHSVRKKERLLLLRKMYYFFRTVLLQLRILSQSTVIQRLFLITLNTARIYRISRMCFHFLKMRSLLSSRYKSQRMTNGGNFSSKWVMKHLYSEMKFLLSLPSLLTPGRKRLSELKNIFRKLDLHIRLSTDIWKKRKKEGDYEE